MDCIREELQLVKKHNVFVEKALEIVFESKASHLPLLVELFAALFEEKPPLMTTDGLMSGFQKMFDCAEDLAIDIPGNVGIRGYNLYWIYAGYLFVCLFVCLFACLFGCLFGCLFACLIDCLLVYLFICLLVCLFVCLFNSLIIFRQLCRLVNSLRMLVLCCFFLCFLVLLFTTNVQVSILILVYYWDPAWLENTLVWVVL